MKFTRTRRTVMAVIAGVALAAATLVAPTASPPPASAAEAMGAYLFAYFTGEGTANGEQIRFAVSRGDSAVAYDTLNQGNPILVSTVGTKGVRDPYIMRKQDGSFILMATDLRIYGGSGWDASQRTGSRSIVFWESTDLVNWSAPRLQTVIGATAGNVWAPEAYWDASQAKYVVFWASKLYATTDPNHTANTYNKMMYSTTTDFRTFSTPVVWNDPGYSVIDSTVIADAGTYYRFTKDERGTAASPCGKFIIEQKSTSLTSTNYTFVKDCIGQGSVGAGEGPTIFKSNTENRWYLWIDEYGGRGYIPFTTTNLNGGAWTEVAGASLPANPRHGAIMPITTTELKRLAGATTQITTTTGLRSMQATTSGFTTRYWAHYAYLGVNQVTTSTSTAVQKQDATFTIVPGLADASCYSFQSKNYPGRYLRHYSNVIQLDTYENATVYKADATFCATAGKSGVGVSWRSYNVPTRYIRHYNSNLYLASNGGTNVYDSTSSFAADVSWQNVAPWAP